MDRRQFLQNVGAAVVAVPAGERGLDAYLRAIARQADPFKDYGFSAREDEQADREKDHYPRYLTSRPNTCALKRDEVPALGPFVDYLRTVSANDSRDVCGPVVTTRPDTQQQILIGVHGSYLGFIQIHLDTPDSSAAPTPWWSYAAIKGINLRPGGSPYVLPENINGVPVTESTTRIRLLACHVGMVRPFLEELRTMLGGKTRLTAPNHWHTITYIHRLKGYLEYLTASFEVYDLDKKARSREQLKAILTGLSSLYKTLPVNKVPHAWRAWQKLHPLRTVPDDQWEKWLPKGKNWDDVAELPFAEDEPVSVRVVVKESLGGKRIGGLGWATFTHVIDAYDIYINCPDGDTKANEPDAAKRREFVKPHIERQLLPELNEPLTKGLPTWRAYGFEDLDEMIAAMDWFALGYKGTGLSHLSETKEDPFEAQDPFTWRAYRRRYTIDVPIEGSDGRLLYNYVKKKPVNATSFQSVAEYHLEDQGDEPSLFTTVP